MKRLAFVALEIGFGGVCLATALTALVVPDPSDSSWYAEWAIAFGAAFAITGLIGLYLRQRRRLGVETAGSDRVPTKASQKAKTFALTVFFLWIIYAPGGYAAVWLWPESTWAYRWRYSLDNDLSGAEFVVNKRPHDCEFLSAPLGSKHCHYDKKVTTGRIRNGQSGRLASSDEGKTWVPTEPSDKPLVFVSWDKVEE